MAKSQRRIEASKKNKLPKKEHLMKIMTYQQHLDYLVGWGMRSAAVIESADSVFEELLDCTDEDVLYRKCVNLAAQAKIVEDELLKNIEQDKARATKLKKEKLKKEDTELRENAKARAEAKKKARENVK